MIWLCMPLLIHRFFNCSTSIRSFIVNALNGLQNNKRASTPSKAARESPETTYSSSSSCSSSTVTSSPPRPLIKDMLTAYESLFAHSDKNNDKLNEEDSIPNVFEVNDIAVLEVPAQKKSIDKDLESALAWSALGLILGSPAPAVSRKNKRKEGAKLWGVDDGDIPDLSDEEGVIDTPDVHRVNSSLAAKQDCLELDQSDTLTTLSLSSVDTSISISMDEDDAETSSILGSPNDNEERSMNETSSSLNVTTRKTKKNEDAEFALAWNSLAFLLGSPVPAANMGGRKESGKLY